jgi:hypothetical protein
MGQLPARKAEAQDRQLTCRLGHLVPVYPAIDRILIAVMGQLSARKAEAQDERLN